MHDKFKMFLRTVIGLGDLSTHDIVALCIKWSDSAFSEVPDSSYVPIVLQVGPEQAAELMADTVPRPVDEVFEIFQRCANTGILYFGSYECLQHTADPNSGLGYACANLCMLPPGHSLLLKGSDAEDMGIKGYMHNDTCFNWSDRIVGNIIGGAYNFTVAQDVNVKEDVIKFTRNPDNSEQTYFAPDRRRLN